VPLAFNVQATWNSIPPNTPGVSTSNPSVQRVGVIAPGTQIDVSLTFGDMPAIGDGLIALLGSSLPFSTTTCPLFDQGTIPWPVGVDGGGGASTMFVVQLAASNGCQVFAQFW
jgi:hypothetical protein